MKMYLILLTLSTILNEIDTSTIHHCPVAIDGKSYELHCSGRTSNEGRFIVWNRENIKNRTKEEFGRCHLNSTCFTQDTSRYHVNLTLQNTFKLFYTFESVLTILNVTEDDRNTVLSCGVIYETWPVYEPEILMACRLIVFDFTLLPTCRAKLFMPDVLIVCDFRRVHPIVTCLLGYESNVFQQQEPVDYLKASVPSSAGYYDISCRGFLKFRDRYQTTYYVRMLYTYELDIKEGGNITQSRVQEVTLKWSPQTVINSPHYISICPPNMSKNVTVYCSATSSSQNVKLNLFVDNSKVIPQKPPTQLDVGLYITMQEYTLEVDTRIQNKSLSCQREGFSNDTAKINVFVQPTSNPLFVFGEEMGIDHLNVNPEDANLSITCHVKGGVPLVNKISVVCFLFNGTRFLTIHNFSNFVYFRINGNLSPLGSYCTCSAQHVSDCYIKNALLRISVNSFHKNVVESKSQSYTSYIIYIAASLVSITLLSVVIAMSAFFWRHRNDMHSSKVHYSYIVETSNNTFKFPNYSSVSETTDRYSNCNAPPLPPRSILKTSNGAKTLSAVLKYASEESSSGVQTEKDNTTDQYNVSKANPVPPRSILKASKGASTHSTDFKYTSKESSSRAQTEEDERHLNVNETYSSDHECISSSEETNVKIVDEKDPRSDVVQNLTTEKFPPFKHFSYNERPVSLSSKALNKLRFGCEEKLCSEDSETSLSDKCLTVSQRQRMRETQRLLKVNRQQRMKKREKYFLSSSEESLAQTSNYAHLKRLKKYNTKQYSNNSLEQKMKRTPSNKTLSFHSPSYFLPEVHSLSCPRREKMSDKAFIKESYSENLLFTTKQSLDEKEERNTRGKAEACFEEIECLVFEKGKTGDKEILDLTYGDTVKTMLSKEHNHVRDEDDVIFTTRMKSKMPGESNYHVLKGTKPDHLEKNPFILCTLDNEHRLENTDNLSHCKSLPDKEFRGENKDNYVFAFMNTINPSEDSL